MDQALQSSCEKELLVTPATFDQYYRPGVVADIDQVVKYTPSQAYLAD